MSFSQIYKNHTISQGHLLLENVYIFDQEHHGLLLFYMKPYKVHNETNVTSLEKSRTDRLAGGWPVNGRGFVCRWPANGR